MPRVEAAGRAGQQHYASNEPTLRNRRRRHRSTQTVEDQDRVIAAT